MINTLYLHMYQFNLLKIKKMKTYKLAMTFGNFGTKKQVTKEFTKPGRELVFEISEFVGQKGNEHHAGTFYENITCDDIKSFMKKYIEENNFNREFFGVYELDSKKELFTEEHLN